MKESRVPDSEDNDDRSRDESSYLFDDPYWHDAFNTLYDPCMRVCSTFGC